MRLCRYSGLNSPPPPGKLVRSRLLTDRALVSRLVDEFDQLKRFPSGATSCPPDFGSLILALLSYPDGHQVTIEVEETGCQGVRNGDVISIASGFGTLVGLKLEGQLRALTR